MEQNFTPLKFIKKIKTEEILNFFNKIFFILFIFSFLFFFINTFLTNLFNLLKENTKAAKEESFAIYQKKFQTIDEINFIPKKINQIILDKDKIYNYFKKKYAKIDNEELIKFINKKIFSFIIVNENNNLDLLTNFNGEIFEKKLEELTENYYLNTKKIDFYYYKVRYIGTIEENIKKLNISSEEIKTLAQEKINYYHNLNISPEELVEAINNDKEISLLNNNEKSAEKIENYDHTTPLFDDPEFYNLLNTSPIQTYTPIYTLKTINPFQKDFENYLFIFFYIENIKGEKIPLSVAINNFIAESEIF